MTISQQSIVFGPFELDLANACLRHEAQQIPLKPKPFAVLCYLVEHAAQLVTKDTLLDALWPDVAVSDGVLKTCIGEVRQALGDSAKTPRFIETVHRRGYRFIGEIREQSASPRPQHTAAPLRVSSSTSDVVGREAEFAQLHSALKRARKGERQLIFVTGEPGIGKTTLVESFLEQVATSGSVWIGHGQCVEQYGAGEAYLPVLEAVGQLCREPGRERVLELLSRYAPTWLAQMPTLISPAELEALQPKILGATPERMLREMAEVVEILSQESPIILCFEDLQWSDYSSVELIAYLARRSGAAKLLVIGTYRPVDVVIGAHPLKGLQRELQVHGLSQELSLECLSKGAIQQYLDRRFPASGLAVELAQMMYQRTEGNPLFLINLVTYLLAQGVIVQRAGQWVLEGQTDTIAVPTGLRQFIEIQFERLSRELQQVLEVASVAGMDFSAAALAAGRESDSEVIEKQCQELAQHEHFIQAHGQTEWPDGTQAARYHFRHAMYQEVLYNRVSLSNRRRFHQQIGERIELAYGGRTGEVAAELAAHFERGLDKQRAIRYLQQAGESAISRNALQEAIRLLSRGLDLLNTFPDTVERAQQELMLRTALGTPLLMTSGFAAAEVEQTYARIRVLTRQFADGPEIVPALFSLFRYHTLRGEYTLGRGIAEHMLGIAQRENNAALLLGAHMSLGAMLLYLGELTAARPHLEQTIALYDPLEHKALFLSYGEDPRGAAQTLLAYFLWLCGYPDEALLQAREVRSMALVDSHPFAQASSLIGVAFVHMFRREAQATQGLAEEAMALSTQHGLGHWLAGASLFRGWALCEQGRHEEGMAHIEQALATYRSTGPVLYVLFSLFFLVEGCRKGGQRDTGLAGVTEALALVKKDGESYIEPELHRLKGELLLIGESQKPVLSKVGGSKVKGQKSKVIGESEACFLKALQIARQQEAKSFELRAAMSLARLWHAQGKREDARRMLAEIYDWFSEGFETRDLQEAKALLECLS